MCITYFFLLTLLSLGVICTNLFEKEIGLGNSIYFVMIVASTVGFGDITFRSKRGRIFACCWIFPVTTAFRYAF
ncbi:Two pore potassium channel a [Acorus gramineus]|nr:Two pore potassium channel a [Acorus gramineus]